MDKALQREQTRKRVERYREKQKALQPNSVTDPKVLHLAEALIDPIKRAKLLMISNALNKVTTGLVGERVKLGVKVRYGIGGFRFSEIKEILNESSN